MDENNNQQDPIISNHDASTPHEQVAFDRHESAPTERKFSKSRLILVIAGVMVLGGIGFAAAIITSEDNEKAATNTGQLIEPRPAPTEQTTTDIPVATSLKTFKSDFPRIEFSYPDTWKISDDRQAQDIRIESPDFKYTSVTGSTTSGNFRIYIRQGARPEDAKYIGRGIAAQPTEKIIYSNPSASQRSETNLSFFGLDSSDNFAYFLIAGNFSLQKDESLGPEYGTEPETFIITGGYSSSELADDMATNPVPLEYFSTTNAYKQALDILKSLKIF